MNAWKSLVTKHKAKSVKPIPEGWLTRARVAEKLGCSESAVTSNLRAAIQAKDVLVEKFPVWDAIEQKVVLVQCYALSKVKQPVQPNSAKPTTKGRGRWPFPTGTRVRRNDGTSEGVVIDGAKIRWDSGKITTPTGSTIKKIKQV